MPVIMYNAENTHTLQSGYLTVEHKEEQKDPKTGKMEMVVVRTEQIKPIKVRFLPGPNEVSEEDWERIKEERSCKNLIGMGKLTPLMQHKPAPQTAPATGKPRRIESDDDNLSGEQVEVDSMDAVDVGVMDAWAAKALIEGVVDKARLLVFRKQEKNRKSGKERTMVRTAIDKQLKALELETEDGGQADLAANADKQV